MWIEIWNQVQAMLDELPVFEILVRPYHHSILLVDHRQLCKWSLKFGLATSSMVDDDRSKNDDQGYGEADKKRSRREKWRQNWFGRLVRYHRESSKVVQLGTQNCVVLAGSSR